MYSGTRAGATAEYCCSDCHEWCVNKHFTFYGLLISRIITKSCVTDPHILVVKEEAVGQSQSQSEGIWLLSTSGEKPIIPVFVRFIILTVDYECPNPCEEVFYFAMEKSFDKGRKMEIRFNLIYSCF